MSASIRRRSPAATARPARNPEATEKPDAAIFDAALRQTGYDAGQVLFVGDNYYDDVVGAQKVGIDCLLLAPYGTLGMEEIHHPYTVPQLADIGGVLGLMGESTT